MERDRVHEDPDSDAEADGDAEAEAAGKKRGQVETTIDPGMIRDLNEQALAVSESLTHLMGGLHIQLLAPKSVNAPPQISSITLQSVEVYGLGVEQLGKTVDKCVDDTVALITKSDELNTNMAPIHELAAQIKEIKRTLDVLEAACK